MFYLAIVLGAILLAYAYFVYYKKNPDKTNMKVYLTLLALGALLVGLGVYKLFFDMMIGKILLAVDVILFVLAAFEAMMVMQGKLTGNQKARLKIIHAQEEQERLEIERNKHFKDI